MDSPIIIVFATFVVIYITRKKSFIRRLRMFFNWIAQLFGLGRDNLSTALESDVDEDESFTTKGITSGEVEGYSTERLNRPTSSSNEVEEVPVPVVKKDEEIVEVVKETVEEVPDPVPRTDGKIEDIVHLVAQIVGVVNEQKDAQSPKENHHNSPAPSSTGSQSIGSPSVALQLEASGSPADETEAAEVSPSSSTGPSLSESSSTSQYVREHNSESLRIKSDSSTDQVVSEPKIEITEPKIEITEPKTEPKTKLTGSERELTKLSSLQIKKTSTSTSLDSVSKSSTTQSETKPFLVATQKKIRNSLSLHRIPYFSSRTKKGKESAQPENISLTGNKEGAVAKSSKVDTSKEKLTDSKQIRRKPAAKYQLLPDDDSSVSSEQENREHIARKHKVKVDKRRHSKPEKLEENSSKKQEGAADVGETHQQKKIDLSKQFSGGSSSSASGSHYNPSQGGVDKTSSTANDVSSGRLDWSSPSVRSLDSAYLKDPVPDPLPKQDPGSSNDNSSSTHSYPNQLPSEKSKSTSLEVSSGVFDRSDPSARSLNSTDLKDPVPDPSAKQSTESSNINTSDTRFYENEKFQDDAVSTTHDVSSGILNCPDPSIRSLDSADLKDPIPDPIANQSIKDTVSLSSDSHYYPNVSYFNKKTINDVNSGILDCPDPSVRSLDSADLKDPVLIDPAEIKKFTRSEDLTSLSTPPTTESYPESGDNLDLIQEGIDKEEEEIQDDKVENEAATDQIRTTHENQAAAQAFIEAETQVHIFSNSTERHILDTNLILESEKMPVKAVKTSEPLKMPMNDDQVKPEIQVRVLTLSENKFEESTLYRLEKNWIIEFRLGPSLFGRKIFLYTNFPAEENGRVNDFVRSNYRLLKWKHDEGCENSDDTALYVQIKCTMAGSFHFYYLNDESLNSNEICGSGYFLVDPIIKYGTNETLSLDCIQCQTVITKNLGSFSTWEDKLRVTKETGYNMIHFTPIQALGDSNSAYSLRDQLSLNPTFKKINDEMPTINELKVFVDEIRSRWKVASICDIVLNHTANETDWLQEHPDATYNCQNCPYLRPAYLLDAAFHHFSMEVKSGDYETRGIPPVVDCEDHIQAMIYHLKEGLLKELKIHELFICDVNKYVVEFLEKARQIPPKKEAEPAVELRLIQDPEYRRLKSKIDMLLAMNIYNIYRPGCFDEDARLRKCCEEFKQKLDALNQAVINRIRDQLDAAVGNVISGIRYWRVQQDGPKIREISIQHPLITRYFTDYGTQNNIEESEEVMYSKNGKFLMAHNGWVMDGDPLVNFAGPQSQVYIRRELIAWGDSVKLRFGDKPSDSPFLWDHMRRYVEMTALIFDGVRLDNCHSTPIHVAEYLLDCARKIRPDLYVVAELFTNSDAKDNIFVNRLGISSLIREALNAWNSHEQGRLVYRFGGVPVGSFYQPNIRPLVPSIAHALFLDQTHDNPSPIIRRSVFDLLPSSAMVNMACCGSGSNRGYDELVPHEISVVDEEREYTEWNTGSVSDSCRYVSSDYGIIPAKKILNNLHHKLGVEGFNQVYVDQMDPDIVAITRHCPKTHQSYILVAFTAFNHPGENDHKWQRHIRPLRVEGVIDEIVIEATLSHSELRNGGSKYARPEMFKKSKRYINGYSEYKIEMKQNIQLSESDVFEEVPSVNPSEIALNFKNFKPGSIVILKISLPKQAAQAVSDVRKFVNQFSMKKETELNAIIKKLSLSNLNRALYRCDQEEREEGNGFDTYDIPGFGKLVYAGFQGFVSLLSKIRPYNDLGHPMCDNLRRGDWMIEYIAQRLKVDEGTEKLGVWIEENIKPFKLIPKYLKPAYFDMIVTGIYIKLIEHSHNSMSSFINKGSIFVRALSMGSLQFLAYVKSADLPELSPNLTPPLPETRLDKNGKPFQACVSLSAGLPHFSVGYMRNWGRDTFIALRGLLLLTGRYQEARYHILGYGACLRHGLIPNLLDGGRNPRYNCRDAVWWWLYCIKSYTEHVPNGIEILKDKVSRIFPTDDSPPRKPGEADQNLEDVIQEALNTHFQGLTFRERNAGREIDEHMVDNGFNNQIGVHPETGFVFGGNGDNCGTWMDKMGSSIKSGNKGKPATPRDGSACEIVGLSKSVITWLASLHQQKKYEYEGVERKHPNGNVTKWSFESWANKIQKNFEKYFWVNEKPTKDEIRPDLINKRGIYKDCYGATQEWTDFQLRCNFPIVMVVAPELFSPEQAWVALQQAQKSLLGPLGMKTLDPTDWAYRGDYDNSNDSADSSVAQGFNYHQGPEWVWPIGYFLRAKLIFSAKNNKLKETIAEIKYILSKHFTELQTSDWKGLPELTNSNGSYCNDSSRTQAWSMSTILELLYDLQRIESS